MEQITRLNDLVAKECLGILPDRVIQLESHIQYLRQNKIETQTEMYTEPEKIYVTYRMALLDALSYGLNIK